MSTERGAAVRPKHEPDPPLSLAAVADQYGVSRRWLADECRAGRVEHVKLGGRRMLTPSQVDALLKRHTVTAAPSPRERSMAAIRRGRGRSA